MRACLLVLLLARPGFGEDVDQLKKAVADVDPAVRLEAVKKLRAMGPRAAPAVEVLVDAAYDESREVQIDAIRALRAVGPAARDAVHPLQELRGFDNVLLRHVQLALNAIGTAGVPAPKLKGAGKEALLAALKSEDARTRGQAAFYLRRIVRGDASSVAPLARALDHPSQYARMQVFKTMRVIRHVDVVAPMLKELRHADVRRRRLAALGFGWQTPDVLKGLIAALGDGDHVVRRHAVGAIGQMRERGLQAVPQMLALLESEPKLREAILAAFPLMRAAEAVPALASYLDSGDLSLRQRAASSLSYFYDAAALEAALPALIRASFDEDRQVMMGAMKALGYMKARAAPAAPYLAELAEAAPTLRGIAKQYLAQIGAGAPLPPAPRQGDIETLLRQLNDIEVDAAGRAAFQLGRLKTQDARVLAALRRTMGSKRRYVRTHAAFALESAGEAAIPQFADVFRTGKRPARMLAIRALVRLGALAEQPPLDLYVEALSDPDPDIRIQAAVAVGNAGLERGLPDLIRLVKAGNGASATALFALGRFGPKAALAVPTIVAKLADWEDQSLANAMIHALGQIGEAAAPAVPLLVDAALWGKGLDSTVMQALLDIGPAGHAGLVDIVRRGSGHVRSFAIERLMWKNLRPPGLREALVGAVEDPIARATALRALLQSSDDEPIDVDTLMRAMRQEPGKRYVRSQIPYTLAKTATPDQLIPYLGDQDERIRWCAWSALSQMDAKVFSKKHKLALGPLILEALAMSTPERGVAVAMLAKVPPTNITAAFLRVLGDVRLPKATIDRILALPGVLDRVVAGLKHEDFEVREGALTLVHAFGPRAEASLPALRAAMEKDPEHSTYYLSGMVSVGARALPFLIGYLPRARRTERRILLDGIARMGDAALPVLRRLFSTGDAAVRRQIVFVLWRYKDKGLDTLLRAARDGDSKVRSAAYSYLGRLPDHADKSVPILVAALPDKNALSALRALGKRAAGGIRKAAASKEPAVRVAAMQALNRLGKDALPLVIAGLEDKDPTVRRAAIDAAGALGGRAASLVPRLHKALKDPSPLVRREAAVELPKLGGAARVAIPEIVKMFVQGNRYDRGAASTSLQRFGAPALPYLAALLAHKDNDVAKQAARTLRKIGQPAIEVLIQRFEKGPERARDHAGQVLVSLQAAESLAGLLTHKSTTVRRIAAWRLGQLQRSAIPAISALIKTLVDKDIFVVGQAAWALGEIGPAAEAALPALEKLVRSGRLVDIARDAIKKIRG